MLDEALQVIGPKADPVSAAILSGLLTMGYARHGDFAAAERSIQIARKLAANGDPIAALDVDIATSGMLLERGDIQAAEALATSCAGRSEDLGALACAVPANVMSGAAHLARDDAAGAVAPLERGEALSHIASMGAFQTLAEGMLGSVRARLGDAPAGKAGWDGALERARATNDRHGEAITLWLRSLTYAHATPPDLAAAIADADVAVTLFEQMEARPGHARALRDQAWILRALGRGSEADAAAQRAQALGTELGLKDFATPQG
jgi:hypothetical protein